MCFREIVDDYDLDLETEIDWKETFRQVEAEMEANELLDTIAE